ncbi:glycosyl hydrolase [Conexibacter sp. SYSU D00693]|uniref:glycosyl hydrolase n=1 Tax=Conexibacter sp. SYSU D00693 TaxID=2812560 RepID=UPI00196A44A4|nr:glycosyl hydrolase [Conexibacter sp. SYSU D00693]
MLRRTALPAAVLAALAVAPAQSQAATYGFSEQQASMFSNPLYQALKKVKVARYIAPYDVATDARDRATFQRWYDAAQASGDKMLVSFYYDRDRVMHMPSSSEFKKQMKLFKAAFPAVESISPWNEANKKAPGRFANPSAKQAAGFYNVARSVFKGKEIVALDVLDQNNVKPTLTYIKQFKKHANGSPRLWGLHNYSDTNRFGSKRTKAVLDAVKGDVWLTETGGLVRFGGSFPYNEQRAAKALKFMFKLAKSNKRLKRLYIYQWHGDKPDAVFDAGLVNALGTAPRPGYTVVKRELG